MNEEKRAEALARWLASPPGTPPPEGMDPEVIEVIYALDPSRAPAPRVRVEEILAEVRSGPLSEGAAPVIGEGVGEVVAFPGPEPEPIRPVEEEDRPRRGGWARRWGPVGVILAAAAAFLLVLRLDPVEEVGEQMGSPTPTLDAELDAIADLEAVDDLEGGDVWDAVAEPAAPPPMARPRPKPAPMPPAPRPQAEASSPHALSVRGESRAAPQAEPSPQADLAPGPPPVASPPPPPPAASPPPPAASGPLGGIVGDRKSEPMDKERSRDASSRSEHAQPIPEVQIPQADAPLEESDSAAPQAFEGGGPGVREQASTASPDRVPQIESAPSRKVRQSRARSRPDRGPQVRSSAPSPEAAAEAEVGFVTEEEGAVSVGDRVDLEDPREDEAREGPTPLREQAIPRDMGPAGPLDLLLLRTATETQQMVASGALQAAADHAKAVLDAHPAPTAPRSGLLVAYGDALWAMGQIAEAEAAWRTAIEANQARERERAPPQ